MTNQEKTEFNEEHRNLEKTLHYWWRANRYVEPECSNEVLAAMYYDSMRDFSDTFLAQITNCNMLEVLVEAAKSHLEWVGPLPQGLMESINELVEAQRNLHDKTNALIDMLAKLPKFEDVQK